LVIFFLLFSAFAVLVVLVVVRSEDGVDELIADLNGWPEGAFERSKPVRRS
jgi:hypothetical protein